MSGNSTDQGFDNSDITTKNFGTTLAMPLSTTLEESEMKTASFIVIGLAVVACGKSQNAAEPRSLAADSVAAAPATNDAIAASAACEKGVGSALVADGFVSFQFTGAFAGKENGMMVRCAAQVTFPAVPGKRLKLTSMSFEGKANVATGEIADLFSSVGNSEFFSFGNPAAEFATIKGNGQSNASSDDYKLTVHPENGSSAATFERTFSEGLFQSDCGKTLVTRMKVQMQVLYQPSISAIELTSAKIALPAVEECE
jgi:hypothetical protein